MSNMNEIIFQNKIKSIVKNFCDAEKFETNYKIITIDSDNFTYDIDNSDFCFVISEKIDIPQTAQVVLISADNFLITSKNEVEIDNIFELENFSNYLNIITKNYGLVFIPYKLKLAIITPYK